MKTYFLAVILLLSLIGCVSQAQLAENRAESRHLAETLEGTIPNSQVTCINKKECDKAFSLAKIYMQAHSDMKMQFSDDTIASTYGPINYGDVGLRLTRIPGADESATIKLEAFCKGMDSGLFNECARRIFPIYQGFKIYIESSPK